MIATNQTARLWHPWLRIQRVIRVILGTRWGADEWPIVKAELRDALKERSRIERAGWFIHENAPCVNPIRCAPRGSREGIPVDCSLAQRPLLGHERNAS